MGVSQKRDGWWTNKKLTNAARFWVREIYKESKESRNERVQALARKLKKRRAPQRLIDKVLNQDDENENFNVWPENHVSVLLFLSLQSQWERNPLDNSLQKLNWPSVEIAIKRHPNTKALMLDEQDQIFWDISAMERHAINEISKVKSEQNQ